MEVRGASFSADEQLLVIGRNSTRPAGICVGRGGRLFLTVLKMPQLESSPACPSNLEMITRADDPAGFPFDAYDPVAAPVAKLWAELSQGSWWRRNRAHQGILRRSNEPAVRLAAVLSAGFRLTRRPAVGSPLHTCCSCALPTGSRNSEPIRSSCRSIAMDTAIVRYN